MTNSGERMKTLSLRLSESGFAYSIFSDTGSTAERYVPYASSGRTAAESLKQAIEAEQTLDSDFSAVQIFADTSDTVYVPVEVLSETPAVKFLNEAGIYPDKDQKVIISPSVDNLCAVIVWDKRTVEYLVKRFGDKLRFYSPLQENLGMAEGLNMKKGGWLLNLVERNIYITAFSADGRLFVAEVYPYSTEADVIYYLTELKRDPDMPKGRIYLMGVRASGYLTIIKTYFRKVSCV